MSFKGLATLQIKFLMFIWNQEVIFLPTTYPAASRHLCKITTKNTIWMFAFCILYLPILAHPNCGFVFYLNIDSRAGPSLSSSNASETVRWPNTCIFFQLQSFNLIKISKTDLIDTLIEALIVKCKCISFICIFFDFLRWPYFHNEGYWLAIRLLTCRKTPFYHALKVDQKSSY